MSNLDVLLHRLGDRLHAIPLNIVDKVVQAVAITSLPDPPPGIKGVIDVQGAIVPVVDLHAKCGLPSEPGGLAIAQSQDSSAVWGMPGKAVELGCADLQLDPDAIARLVGRLPTPFSR